MAMMRAVLPKVTTKDLWLLTGAPQDVAENEGRLGEIHEDIVDFVPAEA